MATRARPASTVAAGSVRTASAEFRLLLRLPLRETRRLRRRALTPTRAAAEERHAATWWIAASRVFAESSSARRVIAMTLARDAGFREVQHVSAATLGQ